MGQRWLRVGLVKMTMGALIVPLLGVASGCASHAQEQGVSPPRPVVVENGLFAKGAELLAGIDDGVDENVGLGDDVLLGMCVRTPREETICYIRLTVVEDRGEMTFMSMSAKIGDEPFPLLAASPVVGVQTRVYDHELRVQSETKTDAPAWLLGRLNDALQVMHMAQATTNGELKEDSYKPLTKEDKERLLWGIVSLTSFSSSLAKGKNTALAEVLWTVVDKPGLLDFVFGGLSMQLSMNGPSERLSEPAGAYQTPLTLSIAGRDALVARLTASPRSRPTALCGGITAIDAYAPAHPERTVTVKLLAAKRGSGSPTGVEKKMPQMTPVSGAAVQRPEGN